MSSMRLTWRRKPGDAWSKRPDGAVLRLGTTPIGEVVPNGVGVLADRKWDGYFWVAGGTFGHGIPYKNTCDAPVALDEAKRALKAYVVEQLKKASGAAS